MTGKGARAIAAVVRRALICRDLFQLEDAFSTEYDSFPAKRRQGIESRRLCPRRGAAAPLKTGSEQQSKGLEVADSCKRLLPSRTAVIC
ncbi:hypothetical protein BCEP4_320103 [Burkholderia cepacia]|nr:hypothetical protein BCEP4_320103 [Burkholderia cepacia]